MERRAKKILTTTSIWALALGLLAPAGHSQPREAALGADGELYVVRTGTYASLFPRGRETAPQNPVLALEITHPGAAPQRVLVPGTAGLEAEASPAVIYEDDSSTVFLLWANQSSYRSTLKLSSFDGARFTEPLEILGNSLALKSAPQLVVTRDAYGDKDAAGNAVTRHRTVLHLLWAEDTADGSFNTYYTPVIFEDGSYLGRNPILDLEDYDPTPRGLPPGPDPVPELNRQPVIQAGQDGRTVVAAFTSAISRHLNVVEIDILPKELSRLADTTRATIIELGSRPGNRISMTDLATQVRTALLEDAGAFHEEVAKAIADRVYELIVGSDPNALQGVADTTRATIIELGSRLSGRGLRGTAASDVSRILKFTSGTDNTELGTSTDPQASLVQVRVKSSRLAPSLPVLPTATFLSEDGEQVLIAAAQADKISYRKSQGVDGWSDVRELKLSDTVGLDRAYQILEQRVRNR